MDVYKCGSAGRGLLSLSSKWLHPNPRVFSSPPWSEGRPLVNAPPGRVLYCLKPGPRLAGAHPSPSRAGQRCLFLCCLSKVSNPSENNWFALLGKLQALQDEKEGGFDAQQWEKCGLDRVCHQCGLLLLFPSSLVGLRRTQILFKKQEDSLAVKLCSVCVIPFPPFHEFFRADQHLFSTTVFFLFFSNLVRLAVG